MTGWCQKRGWVVPQSTENNRFKILIADDHEAVRRGLRFAVASAGWELCGEAVHGKDAVEKVQALNPDLVILDERSGDVSRFQADLEADRQVANTLAELIIGGSLASIEMADETGGRSEGAA